MAVSPIVRFQKPANAAKNWQWEAVEFPLIPTVVRANAGGVRPDRPDGAARRIAIIKADDLRAPSANWDRFLDVSARMQVKVSIGIICDSLLEDQAGYSDWLHARQASGAVEFWNHGWDHKRLKGDGRTVSEYRGSGYDYQKRHFTDSQELMRKVLGDPPVALGTPWNDFDRDTVRVVNEDPNVGLFFGHQEGIFEAGNVVVRMLQAEADGTGKPSFAKFRTLYEDTRDRLDVIALQFHPGVFQERSFVEYELMLDFLLQEGWTFLQPREVLDLLDH